MNTTKLDAALKKYTAARDAAIRSGVPAAKLDGSLVEGDTPEIRRYNRATRAVELAAQASYATHQE